MTPCFATALAAIVLTLAPTSWAAPQLQAQPSPEAGPLEDQEAGAPRPQLPIVAAAVGDDIIKFESLVAQIQAEMTRGRIRDRREADARMSGLLQELITLRLKVQAGRDLGFDPNQIEAYISRVVERQKEVYGGTVGTSAFLEERGIGPGQWRDLAKDDIYSNQWELAILGLGPSATGRATVDRYIRPGELHAYYQSVLVSRDPSERAKIGELGERVILQELILPVGGQDEQVVRDRADFLLAELERGADFTELVKLHGAGRADWDGIQKAQPVSALQSFSTRRHGTAVLFEFAENAAAGAVSEPQLGQAQSGDRAVWVYRLIERLPAVGPTPFVDGELQIGLRKDLEDRIDDVREAVALQRVANSAYIWPRDSWTAGRTPLSLTEVDF